MTLAKLQHPNIATLYGLSRRSQELFMVMEYVRGETLEQVLRRLGRLPWDQVVRLGRQVLGALAYAHGMHVVHRDIKPSNLMVDAEGRVKVMDFGLARVLGTDRATRMGHIVGTLEYMSPEQIRGQEVDGRTDQYSLAIVLYELPTGSIPFAATSDFALMTAHLESEVPALTSALPGTPAWLDSCIRTALAKRIEDRYDSAHAFRTALASRSSDDAGEFAAVRPQPMLIVEATEPVPLEMAAAAARPHEAPATRLAGSRTPSVPRATPTRLASSSEPEAGPINPPIASWVVEQLRRRPSIPFGVAAAVLVFVVAAVWLGSARTGEDAEASVANVAVSDIPVRTEPSTRAWTEAAQPISPASPSREPMHLPPLAVDPAPIPEDNGGREARTPIRVPPSRPAAPLEPPALTSESRAPLPLPPVSPSGATGGSSSAPRMFENINLLTWNSEEEENEEVDVRLTCRLTDWSCAAPTRSAYCARWRMGRSAPPPTHRRTRKWRALSGRRSGACSGRPCRCFEVHDTGSRWRARTKS